VYGPAQHEALCICDPIRYALGTHAPYCQVLTGGTGPLVPQNESTAMLPRSPYAATKIAADRFAYAFAVTYGLRLTILRPSNVFGPYQRHGAAGAVIPSFTRRALLDEPLVITGGGNQVREFLSVSDAVNAYLLTLDLDPDQPGEAFNVGSGETRSILSLALLIKMLTNSPSEIVHGGQRVADVSGFLLDSRKFHAWSGWKPRLNFPNALDEYLAWARDPEQGRPWLLT
jgi:UDP-glucose 4-epimerase